MANAAIAYINLADSGLILGSNQIVTMPASNVQNVHVQKRWRSATNAGFFVVDLLSPQSIDTIGLFGTTMSNASGTARARLSTVDTTGVAGDAYDSGVLGINAKYNQRVFILPSPVTARYVRIDLSDALGTYTEAGRLFVGLRTLFTYNFDYGWQKGFVDRSIRTKTRGGQTQVWVDNSYRVLDVTFSTVSAAQRDALVEEIDRINGQKTDVLFMIDSSPSVSSAVHSIWGLMSELTMVTQPHFDIYTKQYKIEERL
jgi:hypothetical protein